MNRRRRLLLAGTSKHYIFAEGNPEILNSTGDYKFDHATLGSFIGIDAYVKAIVGSVNEKQQGYGYFKIQTDFTGFKKLCIETGNDRSNTRGAVGYSASYTGPPRLPTVYSTVEKSEARSIKQFDIENVDGNQFIIGTLTYVSSVSAVSNALKIYNIWLE